MVASFVQVAKRALLATMRAVAFTVGMALTCSRDSPDREVVSNFRRGVSGGGPKGPPVDGDVVLEIPLRRYKSSCHSGDESFF